MLDSLIGLINNFDFSIFYLINVGMNNYFLTMIMLVISEAGIRLYWLIGCALLYIFGSEKAKKVAVLCVVALILSFFVAEILKMVIARPRPFMVHYGVNYLTIIKPNLLGFTDYSFPSGHSVAIFTACTIFGKKYGYLWLFMILASLVGFSRIYLGVHYPFDVLFGALIGVSCSLLVLRFENDLLNLKDKLFSIKS